MRILGRRNFYTEKKEPKSANKQFNTINQSLYLNKKLTYNQVCSAQVRIGDRIEFYRLGLRSLIFYLYEGQVHN